MSDTCRLFPPFGDPWPSCLLPSQQKDLQISQRPNATISLSLLSLSAAFETVKSVFSLETVLCLDFCEKILSIFSFPSGPWQSPLPLSICQSWILASAFFSYDLFFMHNSINSFDFNHCPNPDDFQIVFSTQIYFQSFGCACTHSKSLQSCIVICNPMDCSLPGFSVNEILQARILGWIAMPSSRGFSRPRY